MATEDGLSTALNELHQLNLAFNLALESAVYALDRARTLPPQARTHMLESLKLLISDITPPHPSRACDQVSPAVFKK